MNALKHRPNEREMHNGQHICTPLAADRKQLMEITVGDELE
jgi:hypothetical protein